MIRNPCVAFLGLLAVCFAACPVSAETVECGRLVIPVPGGWKLLPAGEKTKDRVLAPPDAFKDLAIIRIFEQLEVPGKSLGARLARCTAAINKGRTTVRHMPPSTRKTNAGVPVAIQGELTKDKDEKTRLTLSFGVAVGDAIQVVTLFAKTNEAFKKLAKTVAEAIEKARVVFPPSKAKAPVLPDGTEKRTVFNVTYPVPAELKWKDGQGVNAVRYEVTAPVPGRKKGHPLIVAVDIQSGLSADPRAVLKSWLLTTGFDIEPTKGSTHKFVVYEDSRQPSGAQYSATLLKEDVGGRWSALRVGYIVHGPGWSLLIGAAIGNNEAFRWLKPAQRKAVVGFFSDTVVPRVFGMACATTWNRTAPKVRDDVKKQLIAKKTYRYWFQKSISSGSSHFLHERSCYWTFLADGSCTIKAKKFSAFNDYSNLPYRGGGAYLTGPERKKTSVFGVVELGGKLFIVVARPTGWTSLHTVELEKSGKYGISEFKGLAIDGQIEGKYYRGNGYQYRK